MVQQSCQETAGKSSKCVCTKRGQGQDIKYQDLVPNGMVAKKLSGRGGGKDMR